MSFSLAFVARTAGDAIALLDAKTAEAKVPSAVVSFVRIALGTMPSYDDRAVVSVEVRGHLDEGTGSYEASSLHIDVKPIFLTAAPAAA